ncbi:MAG TPA: hypothetical protein VGM37_02585 [Armatimonadota bacterium]|jgi:hypothetical protein
MTPSVQSPAPRNRKLQLAKLGGVAIAAAGVGGVIWPDRAEYLMRLATAISVLFGAISAAMAYEDGQQAHAAASVQIAASQTASVGAGPAQECDAAVPLATSHEADEAAPTGDSGANGGTAQ